MAPQQNRLTLPRAARARLAAIKASGTWGSALSVNEFAAIKSVGFEPVGQVLGAAVYNLGLTRSQEDCGYRGARGKLDRYNKQSGTWEAGRTVVSSSGRARAYGPLVQTLYEARRAAIARMVAECVLLGGHGVVGVSLTVGDFPAGGQEFKAIGTAIRAPGSTSARHPFTSDLSGQDFAKLIAAGVVPVGLVLGISIGIRHQDWQVAIQSQGSSWNVEVSGYTDLVTRTRHDARSQLDHEIRARGARGAVVQAFDMVIREEDCESEQRDGASDHVAEVTIIGTAITYFTRSNGRPERPSLATVSLDLDRRAGAAAGPRRPEPHHLISPWDLEA